MQKLNTQCKICSHSAHATLCVPILERYEAILYKCDHCGFLGFDNPHWLALAYEDPINISDTGLLQRNLALYQLTSVIAYALFKERCKIFDGGGGQGF
ncbi:hypothetical protein BKH46_06925 [Helicobacter sp. 12S02634-8]|uniref:hypothetical protein n=1 Tax=Helicobacter sp. 12S02634-8 TaxID=1476199 RepID=UPI000BA5ADE9|nr:hypothetical protein [Helicobacter sp. 12S02634-8]PAF46693.1 hypothetical protein BKH46_06925 [Helicobacter sp. 12S02634-8]